jgi:FixJ family two-component response regulator
MPESRLSKAPLIAIVEDDELFRKSLRRLMRAFGYTVETFASATDFLAFPHVDRTTCLIVDVQMPGMSGVELYARLIELGYKIPTILVTAYPDEAMRARALKRGIICYLRKPFNDNDLLDCVRKAVAADKPAAENS